MSIPNYALRQAQEAGRNAGLSFCVERARYPLVRRPSNPFRTKGLSSAHDYSDEINAWQQAFDEAVTRWESESSLTKGKI